MAICRPGDADAPGLPGTKVEATISRNNKTTQAKRNREDRKRVEKAEKAERKAQRKATKGSLPGADGEDPDLAGIVAGPQPLQFTSDKA